MAISTYLGNTLLDYVFGKVSFTPASTLYLGLSTTLPAADGTNITEPGNGYARVSMANNKVSFTTASAATLYDAIQFSFPESSGSWGTIGYFFIIDTSSGAGNVYVYGSLTNSRIIDSAGITLVLAASALQINWHN
jgi:hypothetical protein